MSMHRWPATLQDGREVVVRAGWDRTRTQQYFFLTILDEQTDDDEQCRVFSNLDLALSTGPGMTVEEIEQTLNRYRLPRPPELSKLLIADCEMQSMSTSSYEAEHLQPYLEQTVAGASKLPAQRAYEAYGGFTGFKTFDGRQMPNWDAISTRIQGAWGSAAERVRGDLWREVGPRLAEVVGWSESLRKLAATTDEEVARNYTDHIDKLIAEMRAAFEPVALSGQEP